MRHKNRRHKDRMKLMIIGIGILMLVILLSILVVVFMGYKDKGRQKAKQAGPNTEKVVKDQWDRTNPQEMLSLYMDTVNRKEYEKLYDYLSDQTKETVERDWFVEKNRKIYGGIEAINITTTITGSEILNETMTKVSYQTKMDTLCGPLSYENEAVLSKAQDGNYSVEWSSQMIYPTLDFDDKIQVITLPGKRGRILDRNEQPLAEEGFVYSVGFVPGKMSENKEELITQAAKLLDISEEAINKKLRASYVKDDTFVVLKNISKEDHRKEKLLEIKGIMLSNSKARVYPLGKAAAHLTGYTQSINAQELKELAGQGYTSNSIIGKAGLEKIYEKQLRGIDGYEFIIVDKDGTKKQSVIKKAPVLGTDLKLTIDSELQLKLYEQMKKDKSCAVVMNPNSGEVLTVLSSPSYDPNAFVLGMSEKQWKKLNEDEAKPMYNRYKAALCPGSSFKPVIAAVGLTTGKLSEKENFGHSGLSWRKNASWGNYSVTTLVDYGNEGILRNALIYSDNIYFAKAALKIGADTLKEGLQTLGFGEEMPFEFGLSKSQISQDGAFKSEIQLADSGYGQGQILINPIHMASIYAALLHDGDMILPYLIYERDRKPVYWKTKVFSEKAAEEVKKDMVQVVEDENGTGHLAKTDGITIAAKTGTAEIKNYQGDKNGTEVGWFNAFTVSGQEEKQYLVIAMVEDVKGRGGSHYVIPIVKSVFE